jgi:hypothetical protein
MNELKLKISSNDFSIFAGFYHTDSSYEKHNEILNEYIRLYKSNEKIKYFQIECDRNLPMHTIAYICNMVNEEHFIRTDFEGGLKDHKYWLCFYKEDSEDSK